MQLPGEGLKGHRPPVKNKFLKIFGKSYNIVGFNIFHVYYLGSILSFKIANFL